MNQNENEFAGKEEKDPAPQINEQPLKGEAPEVEATPEVEGFTDASTASEAEAMPDAQATPEHEEEATSKKTVSWSFADSRAPKEKKKNRDGARFALIFGIVFAVCVGMLGLTIVLGNGGIRLIREIRTDRTVFVQGEGGENGLLAPEEAAHRVKESSVAISVITKSGGAGAASGFIYREDGIIITNNHVVEPAKSLQVILSDGRVFDAEVVGRNAMADLAVLRIDATGLKAAKLGKSAELLVGEQVLAIGTPARLDLAFTVTFGRVSATNRLLPVRNEEGDVVKKWTVIQTDTTINPGNSGGPLANMYGEVVGVATMKYTIIGDSIYEGVGFALPIDGVKTVVEQILKTGAFTGVVPYAEGPSRIGLQGHGVIAGKWYFLDPLQGVKVSDTEMTGYYYAPFDGLYVNAVLGINAQSKLQRGDIVLSINGLSVNSVQQVIGEVNRHYIGEAVEIKLMRYRSGDIEKPSSYEERTVTVVLGED